MLREDGGAKKLPISPENLRFFAATRLRMTSVYKNAP